jgi:hypothetical protein
MGVNEHHGQGRHGVLCGSHPGKVKEAFAEAAMNVIGHGMNPRSGQPLPLTREAYV